MKWIKVEDKLPKINAHVFLCVNCIGETYVCAGHLKDNGLFYKDKHTVTKPMETITHWMPIPEPSKDEGTDNCVVHNVDKTGYCFKCGKHVFTPTPIKEGWITVEEMTDEQCLEGANILGSANHLMEDSRIFQFRELFKDGFYRQSNISGKKWFDLYNYLMSIRIKPIAPTPIT